MSIQPTMLASIIGALGNSRLPEDSKVQMVPLVPDRKDSPVGAYVKSPSLRSDWKNAQVKKRAHLKDFLDLGSPEGRVLTTAYPDIGEIPVEITEESSTSYYFPRRQVGDKVLPETIKLSARALNNPEQIWTGIIHEALSNGIAAREKWDKDFRGTSPEAQGNDYLKYLYNPGERIAQAHVLYESTPHLQENYSFPELVKALAGYRGENPTPRSLPMEKPTVTSRSAGDTDSLIREARRFLSELQTPSSRFMKQFDPETGWIYSGSRETQQASKAGDSPRRADLSNFLATDEVPETLFGIPIVASPEQYTEADIAFFKEHPRAGGFYELGDEDADTQAATGAEGTSEELPRYYKVQPGDNLSKISKATGVPYANIAKYSKLADPNKIRVGQVLLLTEPYPGKWNNPGNVRWNRKVVREGETGKVKSKVTDGYFLTFDTPQNGLNAQAQVIGAIARSTIPERYQKGELPNSKFTISNLINVYAPPTDKNDTTGYIKFVADELGVDKDAELNIDNVKQMSSLLRAIITRDSKPEYAEWFRDSEYAEAVKKMKTPVKDREEPGKKGK